MVVAIPDKVYLPNPFPLQFADNGWFSNKSMMVLTKITYTNVIFGIKSSGLLLLNRLNLSSPKVIQCSEILFRFIKKSNKHD